MAETNLKAQVIFATITGNNEAVADNIISILEERNVQVKKSEISQTEPEELADYDLAFLVPYTYDEGSLPDEGLDYFDDLADVELPGLTYGIAGSGDTFYEGYYCLALDKFDNQMKKTGAKRVADLVRINLYPSPKDKERLVSLVDETIAATKK
ncbi:flavodoxin domain-containing protein [Fructobacillus fructosus]|uniref:Flavodoxin (FldA) n=1 Tax=Fructobacillus fructosus TaxID=1631 RepID=A0ABM9MLA3_9LACO|nr:flavodoxin domain-containing protein [Fructobacillus fructosus]MBD9364422.1 flavodoxin domain-containing protein [Leuconostoc mesenteroides]MBC9118201.1 flavodoxin domain-containing protein [Fructobacillus fructosus]MCK8638163.1 flavodoxin domain-containing protein [Fructobacillus fructosus]CAK1224257.1 Flavodoxin (FldA) [Fructobacillus fructosus]CAK1225612.1 Flavodoxin (FldA) [Fructobacillus fructosus]